MKKIIEWIKTEFFSTETLMYLITGLLSTAINWSMQWILNNYFHLGYWVTSLLAFLAATTFVYFANKKYTFKNTEEQKKVLPKYVVAVSCVFIVAYGAAKPVLDWFFSKVIILKLNEDKLNTLKGILAGCVYIALNYFAQKFFVFRKKKEE